MVDLRLKGKNRFQAFYLTFILLLTAVGLVWAQSDDYNHPELKWTTFETEHFVIHYHQGTTRTAHEVAQIAEEIYPHITGLYQFAPEKKTELIIKDTDDYSNGGAYFYDNKIEIYSENLDFVLRGTHNWLRDVVTHEFTHIISMQKALKFGDNVPAGWFQVFGYEEERRKDVVRGFPDVIVSYPFSGITVPVWFAEGVAQFQSPSKRYDYRDSHREMILRDRVMTGKLLSLKDMSVFGKNSIGNESAYNQGFAFVSYLAEVYGDSIVRVLALQAGSLTNFDFDRVLEKATGTPADSLWERWHRHLQQTYSQRLKNISPNLVEGVAVHDKGIGNLYPAFSPDGKQIAYLESRGDYLSLNALVIKNITTGKKKVLTGMVASAVSWSPDSRYLVYCKQTERLSNGSSFRDLYIYDTKREKEFRITRALRAKHPVWSYDGKKIAFVMQSDGQGNLAVLRLADLGRIKDKSLWKHKRYLLDEHRLEDVPANEKEKLISETARRIEYWGEELRQITQYRDGRQFYKPVWAPQDTALFVDTSIKFARDIARVNPVSGKLTFVLNNRYDERDPFVDPQNGRLYFACDRTGIFNIYSMKLDGGEWSAHTNVIGGAFMPTVNRENQLVYALYKNQGYKIYRTKATEKVPYENLEYINNYSEHIPQITLNSKPLQNINEKPYRRRFGPIGIMPRLLIDYGTVKPGLYVYTTEILNWLNFFGGFDVNKDREYNIFSIFEYRKLKPTLFVELFNQTAKVVDKYYDESGFTVSNDDVEVNFNLLQANLGAQGHFKNFQWRLVYSYNWYRAKIATYSYFVLAEQRTEIFPNVRYSYLRGHTASLSLKQDAVVPEVDRAINPRQGHYFFVKYSHEWNRFLDGFNTEGGDLNENYILYNYNKLEWDLEKYLPVPKTRHHAFSLRLQGGYIDRSVDDFFNFFAGGMIGLKGYPFYSIEGRQMAVATATYRFPLTRNLHLKLFHWYLDKIYLGTFFQAGDAWNNDLPELNELKSNVGVQLRLETYSWYMFPTRIFLEAAYPLKAHEHKNIDYRQQWKFYVGILFDFDLRFNKKLRFWR
ncbi:MAG: hypothetical protein Kow0037_06910 [Calditrichia bacterium]